MCFTDVYKLDKFNDISYIAHTQAINKKIHQKEVRVKPVLALFLALWRYL